MLPPKKNIPVELLRRSCRRATDTPSKGIQELDEVKKKIKLEPQNEDTATRIDTGINDSKSSATCKPEPDGFLQVNTDELHLERTLMGGQSFRWTKDDSESPLFTGVILNQALQLWRVDEEQIAFKRLNVESQDSKISTTTDLLRDYFQLKFKLTDLCAEWSSKDQNLADCCKIYRGFRILRQDPVENVFSFICATNNNIKRISQMVEKLCRRFGGTLRKPDVGSGSVYDSCYSFPPVERLAQEDVFDCLRHELGFGYRAKFITGTAKQIMELSEANNFKTPRHYLLSLREHSYKETCKQLMQFQGIGRKVADCICLMSMDHLNSVPIDCHIYDIVCRHYLPNLRSERKTLTESVHDLIGGHFNDLHGPLAGWATSILFIAELKHLKVAGQADTVKAKGKSTVKTQ